MGLRDCDRVPENLRVIDCKSPPRTESVAGKVCGTGSKKRLGEIFGKSGLPTSTSALKIWSPDSGGGAQVLPSRTVAALSPSCHRDLREKPSGDLRGKPHRDLREKPHRHSGKNRTGTPGKAAQGPSGNSTKHLPGSLPEKLRMCLLSSSPRNRTTHLRMSLTRNMTKNLLQRAYREIRKGTSRKNQMEIFGKAGIGTYRRTPNRYLWEKTLGDLRGALNRDLRPLPGTLLEYLRMSMRFNFCIS